MWRVRIKFKSDGLFQCCLRPLTLLEALDSVSLLHVSWPCAVNNGWCLLKITQCSTTVKAPPPRQRSDDERERDKETKVWPKKHPPTHTHHPDNRRCQRSLWLNWTEVPERSDSGLQNSGRVGGGGVVVPGYSRQAITVVLSGSQSRCQEFEVHLALHL